MVFRSLCLAHPLFFSLFDMTLSAGLKIYTINNLINKHLVHILQLHFVLIFLFLPGVVNACAVCFSGREETLEAFYVTTIFLTLLPFVMLFSIGYWIYRKHRKI